MKILIKFFSAICCFAIFLCTSQGCKSTSENKSEIQIYSSVQDFNKLVNSSAKIVRAKFEITDASVTRSQTIEEVSNNLEVPYVIMAVLELDSKLHQQLVEQVKSEVEINDAILTKESLRGWFPESLKKSISPKGRFFVFNKSVYDSQLLVESRFYTGYFIFLDENFIFLTLFSNGGNR